MTHISARIDGCAGRITLCRPEALNALSHAMCLAIEAALEHWREDDQVRLVLLEAEGTRAFCAGGDVVAIWRGAMAGLPDVGRRFWRDEYRLNAKLPSYPKPVVALMQGVTMGGGVGLGCHLRHRVVCETTQIAMPEARIGLIPDVGATRLLAQAPGRLGAFLGTTGARIGAGDAIHAGFADHFIPQAHWPQLIAALCATGDTGLLNRAAQSRPPAPLAEVASTIDAAFADDNIPAILRRLDACPAPWAKEAAELMRGNSPLSIAATLALLRELPPAADLCEALRREFCFTFRAPLPDPTDFLEGVRAQLIDKDRKPRWSPPDDARLREALADLGPEGLVL